MGIATILGLLARHALGMAAGAAVAKGYVDADTATQVVGAVAGVGAVWWSALQKRSSTIRDLG